MSKSVTRFTSKKKRIILLLGVALFLLGGAGSGVYFGYILPSVKKVANDKTAVTKLNDAYALALKQKDDQVTRLITAGDATSIKQADGIVNTQVANATATGDDRQIVDAGIAKASLLIQTSRAQSAIDTVLTPLNQRYGGNDMYKYDIYASFAYAYRQLDNKAKADEYFSQIPSQGWNN